MQFRVPTVILGYVIPFNKQIYVESGFRLLVSSIFRDFTDEGRFKLEILALSFNSVKADCPLRPSRLWLLRPLLNCLLVYCVVEICMSLVLILIWFIPGLMANTDVLTRLIRFSHSWEILLSVQDTFWTVGTVGLDAVTWPPYDSVSSTILGSPGLKHFAILVSFHSPVFVHTPSEVKKLFSIQQSLSSRSLAIWAKKKSWISFLRLEIKILTTKVQMNFLSDNQSIINESYYCYV